MFAKGNLAWRIGVLCCLLLLQSTNQTLHGKPRQATANPDPQRLYQKGVEKLQANKAEEAAAIFEQVIKEAPRFDAAYNQLGLCYARMGKSEDAQRAFLKVVQLNPQSWEAHNNLGANYLALGKPGQAAEQFQESVALNPNGAEALFNLGRTRLLLKQATPALSALRRAQKLSPNDPQIPLTLAEAYFMGGDVTSAQAVLASCPAPEGCSDFQIAACEILLNQQLPREAERCFLHAAETDSSSGEKILAVAGRLVDQEDYQAALQILLPLKEKMDQSGAYHDLIGFAYYKLGQPIPAIESYQKALQLEPANENYYLDLGQVLEDNGADDAALKLFQWVVLAHPKSARLYVGLAMACLFAARTKDAREAAERAIVLDPTLETAYTTLAMIYEGEKDWQSLLGLARRLKDVDAQNYLGWYYEGLAQEQLQAGRASGVAQIVESLRRASALNGTFPAAHFELGRLFFQQEDYPASVTELNRAIELDSNYVEAHFLLAMAYRKLGDLQHAQEQVEIHRKLVSAAEEQHRPHLDVKINLPN